MDNKLARTPLKFTNYDEIPREMELSNSGHSMHLTGEWSNARNAPCLSGGPLTDGDYGLSQIHWHWGQDNSRGSEHTINHKRYELQYFDEFGF